jgi:PilZ domain
MAAMSRDAGQTRPRERRKSPRYRPADARATVIIADHESECLDWGTTGFKTTVGTRSELRVGDRLSGSFRLDGAQPVEFVARIAYIDRERQHFGAAFIDPDHAIERRLEKLDPFWQPPPAAV